MRCSRLSVLCIPALVLLVGCAAQAATNQGAGNLRPASSSPTTVHIGRYTQEFAGPVPTNKVQASVIEGFREAEVAWNKSLQAWRLVPPVTQFVIGTALSQLNTAIANDKQQGIVIAGTDELYMTRVTMHGANSVTVTTCDNGSKITGMHAATGRVDSEYAPSADQAYLLEYWNMVRHSGHWAIKSFSVISLPDQRARPCQP